MTGLRDALKELRTYCGKYVDDPDASEAEQLAYDDVCIQLAQILTKHPAEPVGVSDEAVAKALEEYLAENAAGAERDWAMRVALEAVLPLLGTRPQPTLDRDAVRLAVRRNLPNDAVGATLESFIVNDVMAVARPLPTREQIDKLLRKHTVGAFNPEQSACSCDRKWRTHAEYRDHLRGAVLALMGGAETEARG